MQHLVTKKQIRDRMRSLRQGLTPAEVAEASADVARRVLERPEAARAAVVSVYAANEREVQTAPLVAAFLRQGKTVAVPDWDGWRAGCGARLLRVTGPGDLSPGGVVPCPLFAPDRVVSPGRVDLFIVPGLAFTPRGERLGMGGGYYDRLLKEASPAAVILGLAYSFQLVDQLPVEPHDVPVHLVIHP